MHYRELINKAKYKQNNHSKSPNNFILTWVTYGGWFVPFRLFAPKQRHAKNEKPKRRHMKRRKDQITPREKTPFKTVNLLSLRVGLFVFRRHSKRRHAKRQNATRKDEIMSREKTPCEKTKRRHAKKRKDATWKYELTPGEKMKRRNNATRKDEKHHAKRRQIDNFKWRLFAWRVFVFSCWNFDFSCGGFRYFVFSRGVILSFPLFAWRYFVRLFAWRLFVFFFLRGVISGRKDDMAQTSHHSNQFVTFGLRNLGRNSMRAQADIMPLSELDLPYVWYKCVPVDVMITIVSKQNHFLGSCTEIH